VPQLTILHRDGSAGAADGTRRRPRSDWHDSYWPPSARDLLV